MRCRGSWQYGPSPIVNKIRWRRDGEAERVETGRESRTYGGILKALEEARDCLQLEPTCMAIISMAGISLVRCKLNCPVRVGLVFLRRYHSEVYCIGP